MSRDPKVFWDADLPLRIAKPVGRHRADLATMRPLGGTHSHARECPSAAARIAARSGLSARATIGARLRVPSGRVPRGPGSRVARVAVGSRPGVPVGQVWGPFLTALGVVGLTLCAKRSRNASENPVEAFGGAGQLDGVRKTPPYPPGGQMLTHLAEFVESLSWLRRRPVIDNPGPSGQTQG